ncbi:peptidase [Stenotrophomonas maltophilia]|nr:peptidase [Stenotrophomonas maltophilia]
MHRNGMRAITFVIATLLAGMTHGVEAQALRADDRSYFGSASLEREAWQNLERSTDALKALQAPPDVRFQQAEQLYGECLRHHGYLHLQAARNADDARLANTQGEVAGTCGRIAAIAKQALRDAPAQAAWIEPHADLRERALREGVQPANAALVDAVDTLADPALDSFGRLHRQLLQSAPFARFEHEGGTFDSRTDARALSRLPDRSLREAAWRAYWQGMASRRSEMATVLLGLVRLNEQASELQGDGTGPDRSYRHMGLDQAAVDATLAAVARHAPLRRNYQQMQLTHLERMGQASPRIWDMGLPDAGYIPPPLDLAQLRDAAAASMQVLGPDYVTGLRGLLDPAGGHMDLGGSAGRRAMDAFSISAPGAPSLLFVGHRQGDLEGDVQIAHEAGHAMHGQWMQRGGASSFQRNGNKWLTEAFAIYNELKFRDQLYRQASDPRAKAYYLKSLLDDIILQLFVSSEEADLEQSIYQQVAADEVGNADALDALTVKVLGRYGGASEQYPELRSTWVSKRLMYEDPLYLANYLYAGLIAVQLFAQDQQDPEGFRERYLAVLGEGFDRPPQQQVEQLLNAKPDWPRLVEEDLGIFQQYLAQLQVLHAEIERQRGR